MNRVVSLPSVIRKGTRKLSLLQKGKGVSLEWLEAAPRSFWKDRIIEPKMDGIRAVFYKGQLISYAQKKIYNCKKICEELSDTAGWDAVIDGELFGDSWEHTQSVVMSSVTRKPLDSIRFYMFDWLPVEEFDSGEGDLSQHIRKIQLRQMYYHHKFEFCKMMNYEKVRSFLQFKRMHKKHLKDGFEGSMLKDGLAKYLFYKGNAWLKIKHPTTEDITVIGFKEGTGKYRGMLGSLLCRDEYDREVSVSGMSDAVRDEVWSNKKKFNRRTCEVKFLKRTNKGTMYSAQFLRWRPDK